jgi:hypothetical protein
VLSLGVEHFGQLPLQGADRTRAAARFTFLDVAFVGPPQIFVQTFVRRPNELLQRVPRKIAVLVVDCLDAGSIHGQQFASVVVEPPAKQHELTENGPEGCAIVAPESAMVLKSGFKLRNSQMTSMLR